MNDTVINHLHEPPKPKAIKALTPEQVAAMPGWRDKWIANGLSCEPMTDDDRTKVEGALRALYRAADKPEPKAVIFVSSPLVLALASGIAAGAIYAHRNGFPVGSALHSVDSAVRSAVDSAVRSAVDSAVGSAVDSAPDDEVRFLLRCAAESRWFYWGGNLWSAGSAYWSFFRDVCNLDLPGAWNVFGHFETTVLACGPYIIHDDFAMVCDRPERLLRDAGGRLHADDGEAIRWRDGTGFCFWHGLRLPATHEWIVRDKARLDPAAIDAEENAELRRVMLEAFGFDRYLAAREVKLIATDELHGRPRRLHEITVRGEAIRVVEVENGSLEPDGTRRRFVLGAARRRGEEPATCSDAIAASYGVNPAVYREAVRT